MLLDRLRERLNFYPGVVLVGPRQVGKTTLAQRLAAEHTDAIVLDLEREADRNRLSRLDLFLSSHRDRLVVLDEVQTMPGLFAALRPEIDRERRPGRFLLLGSASGDLLRQSSESLAGRVAYLELTPFLADELPPALPAVQRLLLRGGFPLSYDAPSDELSFIWRHDLVRSFLERDLPQLGVMTPAETLKRFWRMLAHVHAQVFNASQIGRSLGGLAHTTVARYLDLLVQAMMVRRLEPLYVNLGKRLVKSPKVYLRDCGLLNLLLNIRTLDDLHGHPAAGAAWEGLVVEQVFAHAPVGADIGFYRTAAGAELDLVITLGRQRFAIECKFSTAPRPTRGFWQAVNDLAIKQSWIVAPVEEAYPIDENVQVIPIRNLAQVLNESGA